MSLRRFLGRTVAALASAAALVHEAAAQRAPTQRAQADSQPVALTGVVTDSLSGQPLGGAWVQLVSAVRPTDVQSVAADSAGAFRFAAVRPGRYVVGFLHPTLDVLRIEPPLRGVEIAPGGPVRIELATPSPTRLFAAICDARAAGDSSGGLVGAVRDADSGAPVTTAKVVLTWNEFVFDARGMRVDRRRVPAPVREDGGFIVCGLPSDVELVASAEAPGRQSGVIELRVPARGILHRGFALGDSTTSVAAAAPAEGAGAAAGARDARRTVLRGTAAVRGVVRRSDGRPVSGATVLLWGTEATHKTGNDGAFALSRLPAGTHSLEVRSIGYAPVRVAVDLASRATRVVDVRLGERVNTLESIVVKGKRDERRFRDITGFAERQKRGAFGSFLTAEDIARRNPVYLSDALRMTPGLRVQPRRGGFGYEVTGSRGCTPAVFLDGTRMFEGSADLDTFIRPGDVLGVEVYSSPASVPPQFGPGCAIVVWTKR